MTFSSPVAATVGTTYVVSNLAPNGHYWVGTTASRTRSNAPSSTGLATSANAATATGLRYGNVSAFPTGTFNASNYLVDPVFSTTSS